MGDAVVHVAPRGHLVQADGALAVEERVHAEVGEGLHPGVVPEALVPAVKEAAALVGFQDDRGQTAVALGEDAFQEAGLAVVVVDPDLPAAGTGALHQMLLLLAQHLLRIHGDELEGRVGLGDKAGTADGHLHPTALGMRRIIVEVHDLLGRLGDALDVLHRLGGQAHHEVELDRGIAVGKRDGAGLFDLVPGDVLVDDIAQALGAGLGRKGQAALAHLGGLFDEALGEVVHAQRRQRQADVLLRCPLVQVVQQLFELAVVGGGQAGQTQFLVAGVGAEVLCCPIQQARIALTHGAIQKARLTEAAAAHTAAQHLNAGAVLDGTHHGHHEVRRGRKLVQVLDDGLGDDGRDVRLVGSDGLHTAVFLIRHIIESRNVDAGDLGNAAEQLLFGDAALFFGLFDLGANAGQLVLALAQLDDIKEIRDGLGVAGAGAARHDKRPALVAVFGIERDVRQVQHGQDVGIGKLILQGKAHGIEGSQRVLALHGVKGQAQPLHLRLHIQPGHERALAPPVRVAVEQLVQNLLAEEGHAHLIRIREAERKPDIHLLFVFVYAARLAAGIAARLLHPAQRFFQFRVKHQVPPLTERFFIRFILPDF